MRTLLTLILVFTASVGFSQKATIGLKAGANVSNFSGGNFNDAKTNALVGFYGGLYSSFGIGPLSLQPEILLSNVGAKIDDLNNSTWKATYLTIPVMLKYKSKIGLYLEAGPQVGFKLSSEVENTTIGDFANDLDLAAGVGLGYQFGAFGVGARYLAGLSKVGDFNQAGISPDFKNSVIQLGISLGLSGGK